MTPKPPKPIVLPPGRSKRAWAEDIAEEVLRRLGIGSARISVFWRAGGKVEILRYHRLTAQGDAAELVGVYRRGVKAGDVVDDVLAMAESAMHNVTVAA